MKTFETHTHAKNLRNLLEGLAQGVSLSAMLLATLAVSACAPDTSRLGTAPTLPAGAQNLTPQQQQQIVTLSGTYLTRISKVDAYTGQVTGTQDARITLNAQTPTVQIETNGAIGSLNETRAASIGFYSSTNAYTVLSAPISQSAFSSSAFAVELILTANAQGQVDLSHSRAYVRDCQYAGATSCSTLSQQLRFDTTLTK